MQKDDSQTERVKVSFEELAYSNMIVVEALVELLTEKGLLDRSEITERVKKLKGSAGIINSIAQGPS